ncbi:Tail sheath protein, subtilisin-like domain containing protein [uncultured Caudovirales phage]|uniref:Tail sheath protein, subtilisin-like domain containing protein n=1 Tax=uncultured Caudovirales phage TaxID=2100421 RepID=A0A6J5LTY9_9CAUD|nr:Tail sheath protein, subtilisin-like domain containing protein [uncultured Caudovirales phage]
MPLFFDGKQYITPTVVSAVVDREMANRNLAVPNALALVGRAADGRPNTALRFSNPQEAQAALVSGELLDAVIRAFGPSRQTGGPNVVFAVRVNPAVRATLNLLDNQAAAAIAVSSVSFGLRANQCRVRVEAGTTTGLKLSVTQGAASIAADNIARNAFVIRYSGGQASASMTITGTTVTLFAPNASPVATIDLNVFTTVQALVDRINTTAGFVATVSDGNGAAPALSGLDFVTTVDVRTADYTARANLQAAVDWLNTTGIVTATRGAGGLVPVALAWTHLTGGSDGSVTNTEWSNAFTALQAVDVQWVVPLSSDAAIHAMADAHVAYMSTIGRMERRAIVGTAAATTDANAIAAAKVLNSDRTGLVHVGFHDYDILGNGALKLFPPFMLAAVIGGAFAGVSPGTALTNKTLAIRGLERDVRNPTDTDALISGGVMPVENTPSGYRVTQSISTWLANRNYNRVELSCGAALDFVARSVRDALRELIGEKAGPLLLARAVSITKTTLASLAVPEPNGPGVIVGDANSPAFKGVTATLSGDIVGVTFQCSPVIPANYVTATIHAVPYQGSASA